MPKSPPIEEIASSILESNISATNTYETLNSHTNPCKSNLDANTFLEYSKEIYTFWYDFLGEKLTYDPSNAYSKYYDSIKTLRSLPQYNPRNMTLENFNELVINNHQEFRSKTNLEPPISCQKKEPIVSEDILYYDFVHMKPFLRQEEIDCRLYINLLPENALEVAQFLVEACKKKAPNYTPYFKIYSDNCRSDTFLLYTNYKNVQSYAKLFNQIKEKHPSLFEGCEKAFPHLPKLYGFIGFAEELKFKRTSYTNELAEALDDFYEKENILPKFYAKIHDFLEKNPEHYNSLRIHFSDLIRRNLVTFCEKTSANIENQIFPYYIDTNSKKESYIRLHKDISKIVFAQPLDNSLKMQINAEVEKIIKNLKKVSKPTTRITFKTKEILGLKEYNLNEKEFKYKLAMDGYVLVELYPLHPSFELAKIFNIQDYCKNNNIFSREKIAPYMINHHLDPDKPYLSIETTQDYEQAQDD